jgi:NAD(P)-dependent dehydrogenase (short-subunit alcohol dehydrogenase family)
LTGLFALEKRVALVTGAGSGLGRAFAVALAEFGARVVCVDREATRAKHTANKITSSGHVAIPLTTDITDPSAVERMVSDASARVGPIEILVNNAGIATIPHRVHELAISDWDRLMAVNLRGTFLCTRAVIPGMLAAGGGSIVNVASVIGLVGFHPDMACAGAHYAASKAGVIGFTRQVAVEYARDRIRVNVIAPGWHEGTELGNERRSVSTPDILRAFDTAVVERTPMGRKGQPEELKGLIVYLASEAASFVTGQVFVHDGGWTAA